MSSGKKIPSTFRRVFHKSAAKAAQSVGSPWAFFIAFSVVLLWALLGPHYNYSDTWQLVINTGTTIITFLMVFLIQNTQNRDTKSIQLKLDELLRGLKGPRNHLIEIEDVSDEELDELKEEFRRYKENYLKRKATEHQKRKERQNSSSPPPPSSQD